MTTQYFFADYESLAGGNYTPEGANVTWPGGVGFIVTDIPKAGATGRLIFALVSGAAPNDGQVLTQGGVTANCDEPISGAANLLYYPAYFREDIAWASNGDVTWTGPALGATHSFFFKGQTANVVPTEILTFSGGQQCEVVTVESDVGATGELSVRWISFIDTLGYPDDSDTFTGSIAGDGALDGKVHPRAYSALELHRLGAYLNTNEDVFTDDQVSMLVPDVTEKDTPDIMRLLGANNISLEVAQHMYGGSVEQAGGDTLFSGCDVQINSPNANSEPVLIFDDQIVTAYWKNAYMPNSVRGKVRLLILTRQDGVDFDGKRIKGKLLEYGDNYFENQTILGTAFTGLGLFSADDTNNNTPAGTVAGAPYNSIVITEGLQQLDFNNGNGATPFAGSVDFGTANSLQTNERAKWIQRRGTAETLFGRNAQLYTGNNLNFAYDGEAGGPFGQNEELAWGNVITYSGQTVNLALNEVVTFAPSGAKGRLIYYDDNGATGTCIFDLEPGINPTTADTMTGVTSGGNGAVDTVTLASTVGTMRLYALDDQGGNGNIYGQLTRGVAPANNQKVYGATSNASADVNGDPETRTINTQFLVTTYTGTNFKTNFGWAIDPSDAILGDTFPNLLGQPQNIPDNQQGIMDGLQAGDAIQCHPWDGVTVDSKGRPVADLDELTLAATITQGVSTQVDVGAGNIPENRPQQGFLRVEKDSDGFASLIEYDSHDSDRFFEIVGTAPFTATAGNEVMTAPLDKIATGPQESFTAVKGAGNSQFVCSVRRGQSGAVIKPDVRAVEFGAAGFRFTAQRISDA